MKRRCQTTTGADIRIIKNLAAHNQAIHVFFYKLIFFWRSDSDMVSQNLERGSNYASDMLILVYLRRVHP